MHEGERFLWLTTNGNASILKRNQNQLRTIAIRDGLKAASTFSLEEKFCSHLSISCDWEGASQTIVDQHVGIDPQQVKRRG